MSSVRAGLHTWSRGPRAWAVAGVGALAVGAAAVAWPADATPPAVLAAAPTPAQQAKAVYDRMTEAQRIGQVFMVGTSVNHLDAATRTAVTTYHVGNVILMGRARSGPRPVRALTAAADALTTTAATSRVPLLIAADQEGGKVRVLQGSGFSAIPSALTQGTWTTATLTSRSRTWGREVFRAGVDVDLAPVMDTVPASLAGVNPIGTAQREYGHTASVVGTKGSAFLTGMKASGLVMTAKHFPGLGHVRANTDTSSGVTDRVTTRTSADLNAFKAAIDAGAGMVMMSSATYSRIDAAHPAVFSRTVVTSVLRGDLGYKGVVVSDDLGNARQVAAWSPGARAQGFLSAGGDLVLTVNPTVLPAMVRSVRARAASAAAFRAKVHASALRVLTLKAQQGLLAPRPPADGVLGVSTVKVLQRWLGRPETGTVDRATVLALQVRVGAPRDGAWGAASMAKLQAYLGISTDGARTWNTRTVRQLQRYLVTQL